MVQSLIFKGEVKGLKEIMSKGKEQGMRTFDQALFELYESGRIGLEDALRNADSVSELKLAIKLNSSRGDKPSGDNSAIKKPKLELSVDGEEEEDDSIDGLASFTPSSSAA
jgi:twitching motility protein PilU